MEGFPGRRQEHREKNGNDKKDEQVRGAKEKKDWRVQMSLVKREGTWKETTVCNKINTLGDGKWR